MAHSTEQAPFMMVFPCGTQWPAESIEVMRIKCPAQGHSMLVLLKIEPTISVPRNRLLTQKKMKVVNLESVNNMQELKQLPMLKDRANKIRNEMIVVIASSVWNSIPNDVRCAPSLSSFKSRLKTYLFRSVYID